MIFALSFGERVMNHFARRCQAVSELPMSVTGAQCAHHFALAGEEHEVSKHTISFVLKIMVCSTGLLDCHGCVVRGVAEILFCASIVA